MEHTEVGFDSTDSRSFTQRYMDWLGGKEEIAKAQRETKEALDLMEETDERLQTILSNIRGASTDEDYMGFDGDMIKDMGDMLSVTAGIALPDEQQDMLDEFQLFLDRRNQMVFAADAKAKLQSDIAGAQAQAFDKRELEKRQNTIDAVNEIKMQALLNDEYANETNLKISKAKLKEVIALEESLLEVDAQGLLKRKATAEQLQAIENEKAALILKIKQQTIINERKNAKTYDDAVIKERAKMEEDIHQITLDGIKNNETADQIKLKQLRRKEEFYDIIQELPGQTEEEYAKTLKALSKLEIDFLKLGNKMDTTDSPQYQEDKKRALAGLAAYKKKLQEDEINGDKTAFQAKEALLKFEWEMWRALRQNKGASEEEKIKLTTKMTEIEIEQMRTKFNEEMLIEDQKNEIKMQGLQMAADFAQQLSDAGMNNFLQRQEKEKQALQDKLDAGLISQATYDKRMEAMERKAFERKKKQEQSNAVIAYVMELANIAVQAAANKANAWTWGTAGLKQYAALAAIASARFIATQASISSQKYADGGMVYGNSHAQGGEKFAVGGRVVELEGGEAVINKRSASMFRNELSAMNVAGGGVDFSRGPSQLGGIDYGLLASLIGENTNVVLPVESLNEVQNRVKTIEDGSRF